MKKHKNKIKRESAYNKVLAPGEIIPNKIKRESAYNKVLAPGEIIPLWRDMMFCQVFGDKDYEFALNYLLVTLLELDVNDIKGHLTYLVKDLKNYNKKQMLNKVDLLLELNGEIINIEVNTDDIMLKRNIVYLGKLLATTLKRGAKSYDEITKVIRIDFNHFKTDKKRLLTTSMIRDEDGLVDVDNFVIYNISMELAKDKCYNCVNEKEMKLLAWCNLLESRSLETFQREALKIMNKKETNLLKDRIEELSNDKETIELYTELTNEELIRNTYVGRAKAEGLAEGEEKSKLEIAKNLIDAGMDNDFIVKATGLSVEKIKTLRK